MSSPNSSTGLFDGKFFITMGLVFAAWMGWQAYMAKKYPDAYKPKTAQTAPVAGSAGQTQPQQSGGALAADTGGTSDKSIQTKSAIAAETLTQVQDDVWSFAISSRGMAIRDVKLARYKDRTGKPIEFSAGESLGLFGTGLAGRRDELHFSVKKSAENQYVGIAIIDGMKITKILQIDSALYTFKTQVRAEKLSSAFTGFTTHLIEELKQFEAGSFFAPSFEHQEFFAVHEGTDSRSAVHIETAHAETFPQAKIAAFGTQYFTAAIIDNSPVLAEFKAVAIPGEAPKAIGTLTHTLLHPSETFAIEYTAFAGPKAYDLLQSVDVDLAKIINLGFFQAIAKGILWLMKTIHAAMGNWGVAIIFLTILVRILVLPFNVIGYKQMKAMAAIQPAMKSLREKYKSDPQKLNQEMLTLMKEAKANPLGGCLPMLLQIPIFFALYQVIGQSIELYHAPFIFWIHDLSLKDPFYVLPILMGITMFIQQKITPNTMEPAQQKIMLILPFLFTFLMVSLPSGLTLYIFVSSVFGVLQQLYFMKDNKPVGVKA